MKDWTGGSGFPVLFRCSPRIMGVPRKACAFQATCRQPGSSGLGEMYAGRTLVSAPVAYRDKQEPAKYSLGTGVLPSPHITPPK